VTDACPASGTRPISKTANVTRASLSPRGAARKGPKHCGGIRQPVRRAQDVGTRGGRTLWCGFTHCHALRHRDARPGRSVSTGALTKPGTFPQQSHTHQSAAWRGPGGPPPPRNPCARVFARHIMVEFF